MGAYQQWLFKTAEGADLVEKALFHEIQQHTAGHLEKLAERLRRVTAAEDCFKLQEDLLSLLWQVEKIEADATGRLRGAEPSLEVRAEQFAAGRGARQLRTIGDALAWIVLGGDRRAIIALSQNDQPGRIYGKGERGLEAEMKVVNGIWHQGHFALLHDITNCLRIDDMTICNRLHREAVPADHPGCPVQEYGLSEIKADRRKKGKTEQRRRHGFALAAINEGADLQTKSGPRRQFRWPGVDTNHESEIAKVLDAAFEDGVAAMQVEDGWVISAVRIVTTDPGAPRESAEAIIRGWERRRDDVVQQAGFLGRPLVRVHSGDAAGRLLRCIPYALYPMKERAFAFLTSDWLLLESVISTGYLESRLQAAGLRTSAPTEPDVLITASMGEHSINVHRPALEDTLLEGVKIDTWAAALAAWASTKGFAGHGELVLGPPVQRSDVVPSQQRT
jgi:hypothetical protein